LQFDVAQCGVEVQEIMKGVEWSKLAQNVIQFRDFMSAEQHQGSNNNNGY
jgi:hypothetical protein